MKKQLRFLTAILLLLGLSVSGFAGTSGSETAKLTVKRELVHFRKNNNPHFNTYRFSGMARTEGIPMELVQVALAMMLDHQSLILYKFHSYSFAAVRPKLLRAKLVSTLFTTTDPESDLYTA